MARLQQVETRNRELYGYGIKGFTLSMIETAIEVSNGRVQLSDIERLLATGREMLAAGGAAPRRGRDTASPGAWLPS